MESGTCGEDLPSWLPAKWRRDLGEFRFESVAHGMSEAQLFRLRGRSADQLFLKIAPPGGLADFRSETERTRWLFGKGIRVPQMLEIFDDGRRGAALMTVVPGSHPHEANQPTADVVASLARGLRQLHAVAIGDCPFDESVAVRLARARETIVQGGIDGAHFADRNRGRSPQAIYEQLVANPLQAEDIVLVHGDAKFANMLIDANGNVGFIDCGHAGRGDRYLDLEAVTSDVDEHFGAAWNEKFARGYGEAEFDAAKLRFFSDLYELF